MIFAFLAVITYLMKLPAQASVISEPLSCKTVKFAVVNWTDIKATTGTAQVILKSLGYETQSKELKTSAAFEALKNKELDVFLGNWMPSMESLVKPYERERSIETVNVNLVGAKYTLAVPLYLYKSGLTEFNEIAKFKKELDGKIYGIGHGGSGNGHILDIIKSNAFGLKDWTLVESSETEMLKSVKQAIQNKKPIVFLGWEPHPMNTQYKIKYLAGGDKFFGADYGSSSVFTNLRYGFTKECPNLGRFFENLSFNLKQENEVMTMIMENKIDPEMASRDWLKKNPKELESILEGVSSFDGKNGLVTVKTAFGIK